MRVIGGVAATLLLTACSNPTDGAGSSRSPSILAPPTPTARLIQPTLGQPSFMFGVIGGTFLYPGGKHPEITIYAIRIDGGQPAVFVTRVFAREVPMEELWGITAPPGTYNVVAYTRAGSSGPHIGAVTSVDGCMRQGCQPSWHLDPVTVLNGESVRREINDWNPPTGRVTSEPRLPQYASLPPMAWPTEYSPAFATPIDAATYGLRRDTGCAATNPDCVSLDSIWQGTDAAYIRGNIATGQGASGLWFYVFRDAAGWHYLDYASEGGGQGTPPGVGQADTIQTFYQGGGCATVREHPGLHERTTECLANGTAVSIDAGPAYRDEVRASDGVHEGTLWWHLAGKGWVAHEFLIPQLQGD